MATTAAAVTVRPAPRSSRLLFGVVLALLGACGAQPQEPPRQPAAPTAAATQARAATATRRAAPTAAPTEPPTAEPTEPPPTSVPIALSREERRQIFEEVWQTVDENYLYADFRGKDWAALHDEYVPRIEAAETKDEFYAAIEEMVAQLDDHHSRFVPPSDAQAEDAVTSGREVTVGIGVVTRAKRDGAFIQIVFPDSPAARADIRPRDRIISVDGRPYQLDDGDLQGEVGSTVRLTLLRPGEKARDIVLQRQEVQNHILPYYRRFPGDIGYVAIPTFWSSDMGEQVSGALTDLVASGRLRGVIVDVRANRGGWGEVMGEVLSHFVRGQVGTFFGRSHVRPLVIEPPAGPDLRRVPLVVLVDGDTASYAEVMAAVLQREAGAKVVGARTSGNTETIYAHSFEDGSRLWLAQEGFRLPSGDGLEGAGVLPDVAVEVDWTRYGEDDDPQLLEALRLLGGGPK